MKQFILFAAIFSGCATVGDIKSIRKDMRKVETENRKIYNANKYSHEEIYATLNKLEKDLWVCKDTSTKNSKTISDISSELIKIEDKIKKGIDQVNAGISKAKVYVDEVKKEARNLVRVELDNDIGNEEQKPMVLAGMHDVCDIALTFNKNEIYAQEKYPKNKPIVISGYVEKIRKTDYPGIAIIKFNYCHNGISNVTAAIDVRLGKSLKYEQGIKLYCKNGLSYSDNYFLKFGTTNNLCVLVK